MKKALALLAAAQALVFSASAVTSSVSLENINHVIPDGNLNGYQSSMSLSGLENQITDINVTLTISGGFNGDFYAYLFHNNTISVLLNRPGKRAANSFGYGNGGFGADSSGNRFTSIGIRTFHSR
jgi:subtilisin-like proprotein convertase family protein